ncbi:RNA polymerase I specific transcription initiation factor RRN3 [Ancylostoma duodenale]|uniref:RNA polymerase I specific transcription initiation factor RRN3 n=1 Tax=Ancylostoma duodenale TaxID=51022 RepID=A0A0C2DGI1_9BILA|nr:RNA polymerase I specific transcription initiation factor RRN3 [Ancylostoma duodenale]
MTSNTDATKQECSSNEQTSQKINEGADAQSKRVITGREIVSQYLKGDAVALITYRKICNALEILPNWEPEAKIQFLEQFLSVSDILDYRCADLVSCLARLSWQAIPDQIKDRFLNMLCDIAIRQVCHTEVIYTAAVNNFVPVVKEDEESGKVNLALSVEEQDKIYSSAHRIVAHILRCFPMSSKVLLRALRVGIPHISHDSYRFIGYVRNLIQCLEYVGKLRNEVWELIIDQMIVCDNMLTKAECRDEKKSIGDSNIFVMDEDQRNESETEENERLAKLDGGLRDVLSYIASKHNLNTEPLGDTTWLRMSNESSAEELFTIFLSLLESRMLLSVHVRYTSFLWLYLCEINEKYASRTLDFLWSVVVRPQVAQADIAKAHGAAAYLAAFLARAKYLDVRVSVSWMSRIVKWCIQYVDNCGIASKQIIPGVMRHGTFYALCQAFFIIFSFRYKEMVRAGDMGEVSRWGLGRIVHSPLDPLKYVSGPVGQCFAAITRSLQLVYCNHILSMDSGAKLPFEPMFPFDSYKLKSSIALISPLLRRFSPLAEDKSEVTSALRSSTLSRSQDEAMDFLDVEDEIMGSYSARTPVMTQCGTQPPMFTIYSSSPGLRHFDNPFIMR